MTGAQLRSLRQANGLSERQFARYLGFTDSHGRASRTISRTTGLLTNDNPVKKVKKLESKSFIPEPLVHLINKLVADGKLVPK